MAEPISSDMAGQNRSAPGSSESVGTTVALTEAEFADAVRLALRHFARTDLLRDNPLLRSRLVAAALREGESPRVPVLALQNLLRAHCERIGSAPKLDALRRVLELTWLSPMRNQQVVAETLHLSWSTYRRRLSDAMQLLVAQLWEAECALARSIEPDARPLRRAGELAVPAAPEPDPGKAVARKWAAIPRRRRRGYIIALAGVLAVAVAALVALAVQHRETAPAQPPAIAVPRADAASADTVTLAVLPFLDMDSDPAQHYFSDGISEELINRLGRFPHLRVAARTSAFVFRDKPVDVRQAARALGVANVLEGSVQRSGERLRVRVALVSARDGYELWAREYEPTAGDLLTVEDEIAEAVIRELQPKLSRKALADLHVRAGLNPAAHDFYLVGLQYLNRRTSADIAQAVAYFRRAIQADPDYAPAWSGSAAAYAIWRDYDSDALPDLHYEDAVAAAHRAVALDPQLARPHAVLGMLYQEHWQWKQAGREFRMALKLDPSDAAAHQWYAMYLWFVGDAQGALEQLRSARDLDPLSPFINTDLGRALLFTGDVDGAIAQYHAAIALEPRFALAHLLLSQALTGKGDNAGALAEAHTAVALTPSPHPASYLAVLGVAQWYAGDRAGAREQLALLEARERHQYVSGVSLALLYEVFGEKDKAMAELARAVADHDPLLRPAVAAREADWRNDPRFPALLKKMGLQ
jgi:TolB-like protein/Tfp pilus assembly protein PilF